MLTANGVSMGAVLACGDGALLSHRAAAALRELRRSASVVVDVTAAGRSRHPRPGIRLHHSRHLHPADRTRRHGIPVTTVARTLLDLAEVLHLRQLERVVDEAERLRLFDLRAVEETCRRNPGRRGLRPLRALMKQERPPPPETRSELERLFLELCRDAGLPQPRTNVVVEGFEVDAVWPDAHLVVELDGHEFHRTRAAFERDRVRDAQLQLAGYRVVRITSRRLRIEPEAVAATIRALLGSW